MPPGQDLTWHVVYGDGQDEQGDPSPAAAAGRCQVLPGRRRGSRALWQAGSHQLLPLIRLAILTLVWAKRQGREERGL